MDKKYYYKAMNKDMKTWDNFTFKVGEIYTIESEDLEKSSSNLYYFYDKLEDTTEYYNDSTDRHFLIEALDNIVNKYNKLYSNKIRIVKEISINEIEEHIKDKSSEKAKEFLALYSNNLKILRELYNSGDDYIRSLLGQNLNTPVYILEELSKKKDWRICSEIAKNPNTPVYILEKLAKDLEWEVRIAVIDNPNISKQLLKMLTNDSDIDVQEIAEKKINNEVIDIVKYIETVNNNLFFEDI